MAQGLLHFDFEEITLLVLSSAAKQLGDRRRGDGGRAFKIGGSKI